MAFPGSLQAAPSLTHNGGASPTHLWAQTRDTVTLHVIAPPATRAKAVTVAITERRVTVHAAGAGLLDDALAYPVLAAEEDLTACWEVVDWPGDASSRRLVRVELRKKAPDGVALWWRRAFEADPPIDVSTIEGRKGDTEWRKTWAEAHEALRERAKRPRVPVDIGDWDGEDEEAAGGPEAPDAMACDDAAGPPRT
eukprot:TRINITY_DN3175_c0_g1_i1.p2 TRINITY_DN3175_c0_g1~~TRINITY_DN3175_c0_g1_i1.p2  ORF type:complete len:221 (-),score=50.45 TRINITY_DN3175_c0_g1_i1:83-670(-)